MYYYNVYNMYMYYYNVHMYMYYYMCMCTCITIMCIIREYGSTLYVGMAQNENSRPTIASDELKSLVIYTHTFLWPVGPSL